MALVANKDVHCWKEIIYNFISFLLWENGVKPNSNYPVKFELPSEVNDTVKRITVSSGISLFMACKGRHNLCMNRKLLDRVF